MADRAYDFVVIGGGTAGLVSAFGAAGLGARVALIERDRLGGDCLNVGCVPSKALLRSARAVRDARAASRVGLESTAPAVDFPRVMARLAERRAVLAPNDSAERLSSAGIDVVFGSAAFAGPRAIVVNGDRLRFRRAVIATGGRPVAPPIPGLAEAGYLTNENVFELRTQPRRMLVIGAGAIGCELAQAFALLGTEVTVSDVADRPLAIEDADASVVVRRALEEAGVRFELGAALARVDRNAADAILVAAGRAPNVEGLGLESAGISYTAQGIVVTDRLQTTNPRVFAAGDVASKFKFTHAADATARIVVQNALFYGRARASALVVPWCTYTMPEVARVGELTGISITVPLSDVDRAVLDSDTDGFVRIHHDRGRVRGCTIVAPHAGELIGHVAYVMRTGGTLGDLSGTIFPYPTYAEALRKAGDAYRRTLLTPLAKALLSRYFRLFR
jgi:pyruvate/2-oxoglutarate dehydrogenase complex dihydrolipoamide dehydrogenase (E3) component